MDTPVTDAELLFLVHRALSDGPLAAVARALESEADKQGLLPTRVDIAGRVHHVSFAQHAAVHPHVGPDALRLLLGRLLTQHEQLHGVAGGQGAQGQGQGGEGPDAVRKEGAGGGVAPGTAATALAAAAAEAAAGSGGVATEAAARAGAEGAAVQAQQGPQQAVVLARLRPRPEGRIRVLRLTAPGRHGLLGAPEPSLPSWWRRPYSEASLTHQLLMRQTGLGPARLGMPTAGPGPGSGSAAATCLMARAIRHLGTARGHRLAVYCSTFDRRGGILATGSDDCLVKLWSASTGLLLRSCRGHDSEVTDLAVSADNALLASGDMTRTIRVWSLQEPTLGWPVSVLQGHTAAVYSLDFHPALPEALLSCGQDGSVRVWNARDPGPGAIVMRPGEVAAAAGPSAAPDPATGTAAASGPNTAAGSAASEPIVLDGAAGNPDGSAAAALPPGPHVSLVCCAWSPDGSLILAGASDGAAYCWRWDIAASPPPDPAGPTAAAADAAIGLPEAPAPADPKAGVAGVPNGPVALKPPGPPGPQPMEGVEAGPAGPGAPVPSTADDGNGEGCNGAVPAEGAEHANLCAHLPEVASGGAAAMASAEAASAKELQATGAIAGTGTAAGGDVGAGGAPEAVPAGVGTAGAGSLAAAWEGRDWPTPVALCVLPVQSSDVVFIEFSHDGEAVAMAAREGCAKVWRRRPPPAPSGGWSAPPLELACPLTEEELRRARIKRKTPGAPAINNLAWTLDDSRVVACVTDSSLRVWRAADGAPLHSLTVHTAQAHVLEASPSDPRLVLSGGYDGRTVLWDVVDGVALRMFSTQDSFPGRGRWTDPIQLVDGHFSPDGGLLALTDSAGELHLYGTPCSAAVQAMARAPYDQFFGSDYNNLVRDVNGWVLDENSQMPPHLMAHQVLCDYTLHPYPLEVQSAWATRRASDLPRPYPVDRDHPLPPGLLAHPPTLVAAAWHAVETGASAGGVQGAMNRAYERHMHALAALNRPQEPAARGNRRTSRTPAAAAAAAANVGTLTSPPRRPLSGAAAASAAAAAVAAAATQIRGMYLLPEDPNAVQPSSLVLYGGEDESDGWDEPSSSSSDHDEGDTDFVAISISDDDEDAAAGARGTAGAGGDEETRQRRRDRAISVGTMSGDDEVGGGAASRLGGGGAGGGGGGRSDRRRELTRPNSGRERRQRRGFSDGDDDPGYLSYDDVSDDNSDGGGVFCGDDDDRDEDFVLSPSEDDSDAARRRRRRRAGSSHASGGAGGTGLRRSARRGRADAEEPRGEEQREERIRRSARLSGHKRRFREVGDASGEEGEGEDADGGSGGGDLAALGSESEVEELGDGGDGSGSGGSSEEEGGGRRRQRADARRRERERQRERRRRQERRRQQELRNLQRREERRRQRQQQHRPGGAAAAAEEVEVEADASAAAAADVGLGQVARRRSHKAGESLARPLDRYAWLQSSALLPEPYVPQLADEVVYVAAGHEAHLVAIEDTRTVPPRLTLPGLRPCELCEVAELSYEVLRDGLFRTAAVLRLRVLPGSPAAGKVFGVTLPRDSPPGGPWLLPAAVFRNCLQHSWRPGERCKMYRSLAAGQGGPLATAAAAAIGGGGGAPGGEWVPGEVVADAMAPRPGEEPPSPYECDAMWGRYTVRLDGEAKPVPASPWLLLPMPRTWAEVQRVIIATAAARADEAFIARGGTGVDPDGPGWEDEQAKVVKLALEKVLAEPGSPYGMFYHCPPPTAAYPCVDGDRRPVPYNALVPLPYALIHVEERLQASFYRSIAAVRHDVSLIASNAERYNGPHHPVAARARALLLAFTAALHGRSLGVDEFAALGPAAAAAVKRRRRSGSGGIGGGDGGGRGGAEGAREAAAGVRRRVRADLSRLWAHVALLPGEEGTVAWAGEAADGVEAEAAGGGGSGGARQLGPWSGGVRGGAQCLGGVSGPRRRGGVIASLMAAAAGEHAMDVGEAAAAGSASGWGLPPQPVEAAAAAGTAAGTAAGAEGRRRPPPLSRSHRRQPPPHGNGNDFVATDGGGRSTRRRRATVRRDEEYDDGKEFDSSQSEDQPPVESDSEPAISDDDAASYSGSEYGSGDGGGSSDSIGGGRRRKGKGRGKAGRSSQRGRPQPEPVQPTRRSSRARQPTRALYGSDSDEEPRRRTVQAAPRGSHGRAAGRGEDSDGGDEGPAGRRTDDGRGGSRRDTRGAIVAAAAEAEAQPLPPLNGGFAVGSDAGGWPALLPAPEGFGFADINGFGGGGGGGWGVASFPFGIQEVAADADSVGAAGPSAAAAAAAAGPPPPWAPLGAPFTQAGLDGADGPVPSADGAGVAGGGGAGGGGRTGGRLRIRLRGAAAADAAQSRPQTVSFPEPQPQLPPQQLTSLHPHNVQSLPLMQPELHRQWQPPPPAGQPLMVPPAPPAPQHFRSQPWLLQVLQRQLQDAVPVTAAGGDSALGGGGAPGPSGPSQQAPAAKHGSGGRRGGATSAARAPEPPPPPVTASGGRSLRAAAVAARAVVAAAAAATRSDEEDEDQKEDEEDPAPTPSRRRVHFSGAGGRGQPAPAPGAATAGAVTANMADATDALDPLIAGPSGEAGWPLTAPPPLAPAAAGPELGPAALSFQAPQPLPIARSAGPRRAAAAAAADSAMLEAAAPPPADPGPPPPPALTAGQQAALAELLSGSAPALLPPQPPPPPPPGPHEGTRPPSQPLVATPALPRAGAQGSAASPASADATSSAAAAPPPSAAAGAPLSSAAAAPMPPPALLTPGLLPPGLFLQQFLTQVPAGTSSAGGGAPLVLMPPQLGLNFANGWPLVGFQQPALFALMAGLTAPVPTAAQPGAAPGPVGLAPAPAGQQHPPSHEL